MSIMPQDPTSKSNHPSHPDQLMARALGVCWHSPTSDRWQCQPAEPAAISPLVLQNNAGETLALDVHSDGLVIHAHDGTEGVSYLADAQDVADMIATLMTWFQKLPTPTRLALLGIIEASDDRS